MYRRTGAGTVNTKEKIWRTLIQIAFGVLVLSACGKQSDEAIQQKSFGIDLIQEQAVESPEQIVCGQDGAWAITAQKNAQSIIWPVKIGPSEWKRLTGSRRKGRAFSI